MRPFAPACEGNKAPILDMLRRAFADQRAVIERLGGERGLLDRMRLYFDYTPMSAEAAGRA